MFNVDLLSKNIIKHITIIIIYIHTQLFKTAKQKRDPWNSTHMLIYIDIAITFNFQQPKLKEEKNNLQYAV